MAICVVAAYANDIKKVLNWLGLPLVDKYSTSVGMCAMSGCDAQARVLLEWGAEISNCTA